MPIRLNVNSAGLVYKEVKLDDPKIGQYKFCLVKRTCPLIFKYQINKNHSNKVEELELLGSSCIILKFRKFYYCFNSFRQVNLSLN